MKSKAISRQPQRYPTSLITKFRLFDSKSRWSDGVVINLSETGLCLEADHEIGAGEVLELVIESVDRKGLKRTRLMCAKVVWRRDGRTGLEFVKKRRQA